METSVYSNIYKNREFLSDLENRSTQYVQEVKTFLQVVKNRIEIEKDYFERMSELIPTEFMNKDCLIKCMVIPLIDGVQKIVNHKEEFLNGVGSLKFKDINESIILAENEISHLHK